VKPDLTWLDPGVIDACDKAPFYVSDGGQGPSFCSKATCDLETWCLHERCQVNGKHPEKDLPVPSS